MSDPHEKLQLHPPEIAERDRKLLTFLLITQVLQQGNASSLLFAMCRLNGRICDSDTGLRRLMKIQDRLATELDRLAGEIWGEVLT